MFRIMRWPDCRQLRYSDSRPSGLELVTREMAVADSGKTSRRAVSLLGSSTRSDLWFEGSGDMAKASGVGKIQQHGN